MDAPGTFDDQVWPRMGLAGHQPHLAESHSSTGSPYLCTGILLPLGPPVSDPFRSGPAEDWTQRKIWAGENMKADAALKGGA